MFGKSKKIEDTKVEPINKDPENIQRISNTDLIAAGKNITLTKYYDKIIISCDNSDTTSIRVGHHIVSGEFLELEGGDGIIINTIHPNKIKISIDYKFISDIVKRLELLEKGV